MYIYTCGPAAMVETSCRSSRHSSRTVAINSKVGPFHLHHMLRTKYLSRIATFADGQLTDALKHLATDSGTDPKVKKKLLSVFASWHSQFKTDPSMTLVAGLYRQYRPADKPPRQKAADTEVEQLFTKMGVGKATGMDPGMISEYERRREKEERDSAKRKAKEAKEKAKRAEEDAKRKKTRSRRQPFDFEKVRISLPTHATIH
jgi:hypothetical protein